VTWKVNGVDIDDVFLTEDEISTMKFNYVNGTFVTNVDYSQPVVIGTSNTFKSAKSDKTSTSCIADGNTLNIVSSNYNDTIFSNVNITPNNIFFYSRAKKSSFYSYYRRSHVYSLGLNQYGQLGHGDTISRSSPTQVGASSDWNQIVGDITTYGIKENGTLWSWGKNTYGQLGHGDNIHRSSPTQVGTLSDWNYVNLQLESSFFIKNGTLWACGYNTYGQLGHSDNIHKSIPTQVGGHIYWEKVFCGENSSIGKLKDGSIWSWGNNKYGKLGLGNKIHRSSPVQVGNEKNWNVISCNYNNTMATKNNGTLWAWGDNTQGQFGQGDTIHRSSPTQVGTSSDWSTVSCGNAHFAAIKNNGTLWGCGDNRSNQLGIANTERYSSPIQIGSLSNWKALNCGYNLSLYTDNDTTYFSGNNQNIISVTGTLKDVNYNYSSDKINGKIHSNGIITPSGKLYCFGYGGGIGNMYDTTSSSPYIKEYGQGNFDSFHDNKRYLTAKDNNGGLWVSQFYQVQDYVVGPRTFQDVNINDSIITSVNSEADQVFSYVKSDGTLWTAGTNGYGELGIGQYILHRSSPTQVGSLSDWSYTSTGRNTLFAIKTNGTLWSCGYNYNGQLGVFETSNRSSPCQVGSLSNWKTCKSSQNSVWLTTNNNELFVFGSNQDGLLGIGKTNDYSVVSSPVQVGSSISTYNSGGILASYIKSTDSTVWAWGDTSKLIPGTSTGQLSPILIGSYSKIMHSSSTTDTWLIKSDGTLWACGGNTSGVSGLGDTITRSSPTQVGTLSDWGSSTFPRSMNYCILCIKSNGTLWAWGDNYNGALGLGDTISRSSPTQVGSLSDWSKVASQENATLLVKTNGTLWACGYNQYGVLGLGNTINRSSPVQVGALSDWSKVFVDYHTLSFAIKTNGTLWACGYNYNGQLGLGNKIHRSSPVQVGSLSDWKDAIGNYSASAFIKTDGTLWGCGYGGQGLIGNGSTIHRSSPVQVGSLSNWNNIYGQTAGSIYFMATKSDNTLWLTGGVGSSATCTLARFAGSIFLYSPVQVGALSDWDKVSGGFHTMLAIKTNGTLWSCGYNNYGQLGLDDEIHRSSPVQVGTSSDWNLANAGTYSSAAIKTDGTLWTCGRNIEGELGIGLVPNVTVMSSPVQVGTSSDWGSFGINGLSDNGGLSAIKSNGTLWVMGWNVYGQLGLGDIIDRSSPVQVGTLSDWSKIATTTYNFAAIKTTGTLWACGYNPKGQLGTSNKIHRSSPVQVGSLSDWSTLSIHGESSFFIKTTGTLWACGYNPYGVLGHGNTTHRSSPVQVGTLSTWTSVINTTGSSVYAIGGNKLYCWGSNSGELCLPDNIDRSSPVQVGSLSDWSKLVGHGAIKTDGTLWGWRDNTYGQLMTGDYENKSSPVQIGSLSDWSKAVIRNDNIIGVKTNGTLWTCGHNLYGQLGLGDTIHRSSPVQIGSLSTWENIESGWGAYKTVVASKTDNTIWTFGTMPVFMIIYGNKRDTFTKVGTLSNWTDAKVTNGHFYGINAGRLFVCGSNYYSQLGTYYIGNISSPVQIGSLSNWSALDISQNADIAIAKNTANSLYIKTPLNSVTLNGMQRPFIKHYDIGTTIDSIVGTVDMVGYISGGKLFTYGENLQGSLGNGNTNRRSSPVQVGSLSDWSKLDGNNTCLLAIKTDGTLWGWGGNVHGMLGIGVTSWRSSPTQVGSLSDWSKISCGYYGTHAIKTDGTLWGWGNNGFGKLGLGDTTYRSSPVQVGALSDWSKISFGYNCTSAIKTNGTLWISGILPMSDELIYVSSPTQIGTMSNWEDVSCNINLVASNTDGEIFVAGQNSGVFSLSGPYGYY